jgi:cytochrome b561
MSILRYTKVAIILHWIIAALILGLLATGWYSEVLPKGDARTSIVMLHKSVGLLVFGFIMLRIFWRLSHKPPALPESLPAWQRTVAGILHFALYLLMFIQPVSGYLSSLLGAKPVTFFGVVIPQWVEKNDAIRPFFHDTHEIAGIIFTALVVIHIAAAIKHQLAKDGIAQRMLLASR